MFRNHEKTRWFELRREGELVNCTGESELIEKGVQRSSSRGNWGPMGQPEGKRRKRNSRGPAGTTRKDSLSTDDPSSLSTPEDAATDDMFLPGIYNHITLTHILPKLCWKDTLSLSSVSRTWLHGIRRHQIHAERVFYGLTETFIVVPYYRPKVLAERLKGVRTISIALYSMKEDRCYELTPLPPFPAPLPGAYWFTSVSLDGKVYVMEGHTSFQTSFRSPTVSRRIMAFDVAGQGGWQPCANLQRTKSRFGCGVLNGKIYVFGGYETGHKRSTTSEVYNPKDNTWSWLKPLEYPPHCKPQMGVGVLGDQLVVPCTESELGHDGKHDNLEVYDPTRDEWKEVKISLSVECRWDALGINDRKKLVHYFDMVRPIPMFTAHGKFYLMNDSNIYIYDSEVGLWRYLHASSFTGIGMGPVKFLEVFPRQGLVVDEELVAIVEVERARGSLITKERLLLRSRCRLGGERTEIVWQRARTDVLDTLAPGGMVCTLHI